MRLRNCVLGVTWQLGPVCVVTLVTAGLHGKRVLASFFLKNPAYYQFISCNEHIRDIDFVSEAQVGSKLNFNFNLY
jgi:hypothetical protein